MSEKIIYNFSNEPTGIHRLFLNEITNDSTVLDVGCATGYLGERLIQDKNCKVWGIEPDFNAANIAKTKGYENIINKRIEEAVNDEKITGKKFDFIIIGDVLEHLVNPEAILIEIKKFLKENGKILVSLPNIAHYSVRFNLLAGKWDMLDGGIMDKTHLHFYTLKTAKELLENSGWKIDGVRPRGDTERWFRKLGIEAFGKFLLYIWPELWAVQFIFVLKK